MKRRIFGIETEYGVTCSAQGQRTLTPDEVARYLFRTVVAWGRSSNVFLTNGARLYLDVGSHPEYATPECDDLRQAVMHDIAGERVLADLAEAAQARLREEGVSGEVFVFKNNTDSAGNSYGCHENFLIRRSGEFAQLSEALIPFLITRQLICGAGRIVNTPKGATYAISQRAEHMWEGVSSATTRSRPIINTRDEPHADAEKHRRLHVIVGDSNMSESSTLLKLGSAHLVLRLLESGYGMRDFTLENPIRAIRDISRDIRGRAPVVLANGQRSHALDVQRAYFEAVSGFLDQEGYDDADKSVLDLWERTLDAVETTNWSLVDTEIDWIIKHRILDAYSAKHDLPLSDPRLAHLDLSYHDINPRRGIYHILKRGGRITELICETDAVQAKTTPPPTTRAKLRGDFIAAAQRHRRDFTVDWVHLKLNDEAQRTILCKDPFAAHDPRVEALIATMNAADDTDPRSV